MVRTRQKKLHFTNKSNNNKVCKKIIIHILEYSVEKRCLVDGLQMKNGDSSVGNISSIVHCSII